MNIKSQNIYDERAKEAAEYLLEQFWVIREIEPEKYQMIREREHALQTYFREKLGYRLIVHRYFAKLEKIPARPEAWMGIDSFKHPRDYSIFCCLLAFLESKSVDEQFLLSDLCEDIRRMYPRAYSLDWNHYEHRKSLVRVMQFAQEVSIIKVVDGAVEDFRYAEHHEVLYEVPIVSRYFMRSYPKDLYQYRGVQDILEAEWDHGEVDQTGAKRRHRVYRQLLLSPALYKQNTEDADFLYLRNYRNRIREDIEKHTDYQFELYSNIALLTRQERSTKYTLFPDNRAICDIALQFAGLVLKQMNTENIQYDGTIKLSRVDFERWVELCKEQFSRGWSKQYREADPMEVADALFELLLEWKMAAQDSETAIISLYPLLVRTIGKYPSDFIANPKGEEEHHGTE
jgi:uncharacterized protein (TIGR02678 family)